MGVGTSLGATFDDSFHQSQNQWNPDKYPSTGEVAPPASASNDDNVQSDQWTQQQLTSKANTPIQISDKVDAISIHPAPADPNDMTSQFNTQLDAGQQADYNTKFKPGDSYDYDMQGWYKANPGADPNGEGVHYPDTFKKPNHPTFSDQSQYSNDQTPGGKWQQQEDKSYNFTPGATNLKYHDADDLKDYFSKVEPGNKLNLPDTGAPSPATPFSPSRFSVVNAFRGMLNGSAEAVKNLPQNLTDSLKAIGDTLSLPGDVLSGKVPAGSIQEIEKAADLGMMMVGGPAPVAAKMADGTLGSFAGVRASGIDKTALYKAQEMEMNGAAKDEIWNHTGFFRGMEDNSWKFEIPDKDMELRSGAFDTTVDMTDSKPEFTVALKDQKKDFFGQSKPVMLPDVIDHPELFKAYPALKTVKVEPTQPFNSNIGGYGVQSNTLFLKRDLDPEFAKSVIMHEVQHAIQELEGFSKGGSPKQFLPPDIGKLTEDFNKAKGDAEAQVMKNLDTNQRGILAMKGVIRAELESRLTSEAATELERFKKGSPDSYKVLTNIVKSEKLIQESGQAAFDKYHQLHGEIEARNVQARMKLDWLGRQFTPPFRFKD